MSVSMTEMREPRKARPPARDEERWQAVQRRDPAFDGKFFFAVRTTGIYCRPSCASRPAKRENVSFFLTVAEAEKAGYRACKRCRPDRLGAPDPQVEVIRRACERIEQAEEAPKLAEVAAGAGLSPYHFHRLFKTITGVTPESLCGRDAGAPRGGQTAHGRDGHRGDLRCRVQFLEPLLRERGRAARHDAWRGPSRRGRGPYLLRGRRGLARRGAGRGHEQGRVRHHARR